MVFGGIIDGGLLAQCGEMPAGSAATGAWMHQPARNLFKRTALTAIAAVAQRVAKPNA